MDGRLVVGSWIRGLGRCGWSTYAPLTLVFSQAWRMLSRAQSDAWGAPDAKWRVLPGGGFVRVDRVCAQGAAAIRRYGVSLCFEGDSAVRAAVGIN